MNKNGGAGRIQKVVIAIGFKADPFRWRLGLACGHNVTVQYLDATEPVEAVCLACREEEHALPRPNA